MRAPQVDRPKMPAAISRVDSSALWNLLLVETRMRKLGTDSIKL